MTITRDDILLQIAKLFESRERKEVLSIIDQYGTEDHEKDVNRVKQAILELSDGKISRLPYFVKCAKIDYRDVLSGKRLGPLTTEQEANWQANANRLLALWDTKEQ